MKRLLFLVVFLVSSARPGLARDINAASCSQTNVQSAVTSAVTGDRVLVPACSSTVWGSSVTISGKNITVQGAGAGSTIISGRGIDLSNSASRITGFTFNLNGGTIYVDDSRGFRYDHNTIAEPSWQFCFQNLGSQDGSRSLRPVEGLIDNNAFTNCRVVVFGETFSIGGSDRWAEPLNLGTSHAVYIEDNTYSVTNCPQGQNGVLCNFVDANVGGRYVARFNTIINSYFEAHSAGNSTRGSRLVEVYNNTTTLQVAGSVDGMNGFYRPFFLRSGVNMVFHNTYVDSGGTMDIDNERSYDGTITWGLCDGTRFVDGNEPGTNGHTCRDQIGTGGDVAYWSAKGTAPASVQIKAPSYFFRNTRQAGAEVGVGVANDPNNFRHIQANRDYYTYSASFNGTTGVGQGTLASRPATCTTGVGYWATDQGEWNSRQAGNDGQLYKCTATNTWALYYTPYTYPHPLQAGGGTPPSAPQNLRIVP